MIVRRIVYRMLTSLTSLYCWQSLNALPAVTSMETQMTTYAIYSTIMSCAKVSRTTYVQGTGSFMGTTRPGLGLRGQCFGLLFGLLLLVNFIAASGIGHCEASNVDEDALAPLEHYTECSTDTQPSRTDSRMVYILYVALPGMAATRVHLSPK